MTLTHLDLHDETLSLLQRLVDLVELRQLLLHLLLRAGHRDERLDADEELVPRPVLVRLPLADVALDELERHPADNTDSSTIAAATIVPMAHLLERMLWKLSSYKDITHDLCTCDDFKCCLYRNIYKKPQGLKANTTHCAA